MKNILLIAAFVVALFGCSKNEDVVPTSISSTEKVKLDTLPIPSIYKKYMVIDGASIYVILYNPTSNKLKTVKFLALDKLIPQNTYYKITYMNVGFYLQKSEFDKAQQDYSVLLAPGLDPFGINLKPLNTLLENPFVFTETSRSSDYKSVVFRKYKFEENDIKFMMEIRSYNNKSGYDLGFYKVTGTTGITYKQF